VPQRADQRAVGVGCINQDIANYHVKKSHVQKSQPKAELGDTKVICHDDQCRNGRINGRSVASHYHVQKSQPKAEVVHAGCARRVLQHCKIGRHCARCYHVKKSQPKAEVV
jgi:hypothetical protein